MFAPALTPPGVVSVLRGAIGEVLRDADFAARIEKDGGRVLAVAPSEQVRFLRDEVDRWRALVARYSVVAE
jgi:tripartite-type tricarboxylate transporter receptor subunit TctC